MKEKASCRRRKEEGSDYISAVASCGILYDSIRCSLQFSGQCYAETSYRHIGYNEVLKI